MAPWESQPLFPLKPHVCPLRFQQNHVRISIKGQHPIYLIRWKEAGAGKDSFTRTATQWKPKATGHPRNQSRDLPPYTHTKKQNKTKNTTKTKKQSGSGIVKLKEWMEVYQVMKDSKKDKQTLITRQVKFKSKSIKYDPKPTIHNNGF